MTYRVIRNTKRSVFVAYVTTNRESALRFCDRQNGLMGLRIIDRDAYRVEYLDKDGEWKS